LSEKQYAKLVKKANASCQKSTSLEQKYQKKVLFTSTRN